MKAAKNVRTMLAIAAWSAATAPLAGFVMGTPATLASGPAGTRVVGTLGLLLAAIGLAAALWQQFVAAQSASCNLTLADRIVNATGLNALIPSVFEARASCADAAVSLLGVPYALWAGSLFVLFGALTIVALRRA